MPGARLRARREERQSYRHWDRHWPDLDRRAAGLVWRAGPRSMVEDVNFRFGAGRKDPVLGPNLPASAGRPHRIPLRLLSGYAVSKPMGKGRWRRCLPRQLDGEYASKGGTASGKHNYSERGLPTVLRAPHAP